LTETESSQETYTAQYKSVNQTNKTQDKTQKASYPGFVNLLLHYYVQKKGGLILRLLFPILRLPSPCWAIR